MVTSEAPMYGRVSPEPTVETISFGTPTGRPLIAAPAIDGLPEPPTEATPSSRPSECNRFTTAAGPQRSARPRAHPRGADPQGGREEEEARGEAVGADRGDRPGPAAGVDHESAPVVDRRAGGMRARGPARREVVSPRPVRMLEPEVLDR